VSIDRGGGGSGFGVTLYQERRFLPRAYELNYLWRFRQGGLHRNLRLDLSKKRRVTGCSAELVKHRWGLRVPMNASIPAWVSNDTTFSVVDYL
jgi:hypothetical protein